MPGISQNPVHALAAATQNVEQQQDNCEIAKHERYLQSKGGFVNRGYRPEKKFSPGRIRGRYIRVVKRASLRCMQVAKRGIVGHNKIRVVAQALYPAVPNIPMNVVVLAGRHLEELKMPQNS